MAPRVVKITNDPVAIAVVPLPKRVDRKRLGQSPASNVQLQRSKSNAKASVTVAKQEAIVVEVEAECPAPTTQLRSNMTTMAGIRVSNEPTEPKPLHEQFKSSMAEFLVIPDGQTVYSEHAAALSATPAALIQCMWEQLLSDGGLGGDFQTCAVPLGFDNASDDAWVGHWNYHDCMIGMEGVQKTYQGALVIHWLDYFEGHNVHWRDVVCCCNQFFHHSASFPAITFRAVVLDLGVLKAKGPSDQPQQLLRLVGKHALLWAAILGAFVDFQAGGVDKMLQWSRTFRSAVTIVTVSVDLLATWQDEVQEADNQTGIAAVMEQTVLAKSFKYNQFVLTLAQMGKPIGMNNILTFLNGIKWVD